MLDKSDIKEIDRIVKEILKINQYKVKWIEYTGSAKSLFHFSEPNVCTRITVSDKNLLSIMIIVYINDEQDIKFNCLMNGGGSLRNNKSALENDKYKSNGYEPMTYNSQSPLEISKFDHFNELINNPDLPDYHYFELAKDVDELFIENEVSGSLKFSISLVNLKKISFKEYW